MPDERTVLDHLRDGRDALLLEVTRLTAAIEQLDSVLGRIGASDRGAGNGASVGLGAPAADSAGSPFADASTLPASTEQVADELVNPPAEVEPATPQAAAPRKAAKAARATSRTAEKAPAKAAVRAAKAPARAPATKATARAVRQGEPPKSIRVHVLEMLTAENREFGLAEIIDRVHDAGIQAHDDAVRSITIKLMKDGRVERVGRGQYRLARRGAAARAASAATATAPRVTETAPEPPAAVVEPPVEPEPVRVDEPAATGNTYESATVEATPAEATANDSDGVGPDETDADVASEPEFTPVSVPSSYTPPLNLGQPWSGGK